MGQIISYSSALINDHSILGEYVPEVGRYQLHLLGVFRLLGYPDKVRYYCTEKDPAEYKEILDSFIPMSDLDAPAFNYEYSNHRYSVKLGVIGDAKALVVGARGYREIYVGSAGGNIRVPYVRNNKIDLKDFVDLLSFEGDKLKLDKVAEVKGSTLIFETKEGI